MASASPLPRIGDRIRWDTAIFVIGDRLNPGIIEAYEINEDGSAHASGYTAGWTVEQLSLSPDGAIWISESGIPYPGND